MKKKYVRPAPAVLGPLVLLGMLGLLIFHAEGIPGFQPFFNLEAMLLVFGGTALLLWSSHPLREIFLQPTPKMVAHAADCAVALGVLGTILGFIIMLVDATDVSAVPRRIAFAMTSLLHGLVFAEVILAPIGYRLCANYSTHAGEPVSSGGKRGFLAFLGLGVILVSLFAALFAVLYALTATPPPALRDQEVQSKTAPEVPGSPHVRESQRVKN